MFCRLAFLDLAKVLGPQCPSCGNPIAPGSGNKYQKETDYVGAGEFPLRFERHYNSYLRNYDRDAGHYGATNTYDYFGNGAFHRIASAQRQTGFPPLPGSQEEREAAFWAHVGLEAIGGNWRHTYQRTLRYSNGSFGGVPTMIAYRADGRALTFVKHNGLWHPHADINDRLVETAGGYEYTDSLTEEVESYSALGRLNSIRSRGGQTHTLGYDADNRLTSVTDHHGRTLTLHYAHAAGLPAAVQQITSLTDPAGNAYAYAYDGQGRLTSVTYPGSRVRTYGYGSQADYSRQLVSITDENQDLYASWAYDAYGQATSSQHAGGADAVQVSYPTWDTSDLNYGEATVIDAAGASRRHLFANILGVPRLTSVTQPAASGVGTKQQAFSYDVNGNRIAQKDFNGVLTCWSYDLSRNLETSRTEGLTGSACPGAAVAGVTRTITTAWHAAYRLPSEIKIYSGASAVGTPLSTTSFGYDGSGNLTSRTETDPASGASRSWSWTYNASGQVLTENGPRTDVSDVTTYTYSACASGFGCGRLATVTNALNQVATYDAYDAHGRPLQITDANGVVTALTYNFRGQPFTRTVAGETTSYIYDDAGQLTRVTLPDSSYLAYEYDAAHRLIRVEDGAGNRIEYTLDAAGNRIAENAFDPTNYLSRTHTRVFNALNRLWKEVGAAGTPAVTTEFTYDNNGNQTGVNAPLARHTVQAFDELNRLKQITDPGSGNTYFGYDANHNLTSVTDPRGLATSYQYTGLGDLKQQSSPDTGVTTHTYDSGGNLATSTDARNKTATFTYDAQGRVTAKGQTISAVTKSIGYGYSQGRLATITLPSGNVVTYAYDANGQVSGVSVGATTVLSSILYEPFGPIAGWTWGNGTLAARTYDTDGKVMQIDPAGLKTYSYDDAFRVTGITDTVMPAQSWSYGYNSRDQLTSAARAGTNRVWSYDANGNRLTQSGSNSITYTVSAASNRLSSTSGALARTYSYDASGNTSGYGNIVFSYNNRGRMASFTVGATVSNYLYNALGRRIRRSGGSGTTIYMYDEAGHLVGEYSSSGALVQETVWLGDIPVATIRPGTPVQIFYVHTDHLNTPRKVSRPSDNKLRWRWDPEPFGAGSPNQNPQALGSFVYNLRFPGQVFEPQTGLYYNYFRDYDPQVGRYVESDPIGLLGGLNTYGYSLQNPISFDDPRGLAVPAVVAACLANPACAAAAAAAAAAAVAVVTRPPGSKNNVIEFPRSRSESASKAESCPPDDDGSCERDQKRLLGRRLVVSNLLKMGHMGMGQYREIALAFNLTVSEHNKRCPMYPVAPLPLGPVGVND